MERRNEHKVPAVIVLFSEQGWNSMSLNLAMFAGYDATGNDGLWVSNGTAAGTYELTGIAGASTTAFDPFNITEINGEVLFMGTDTNGKLGIWTTNGTVAGTTEIAATGGINPLLPYGNPFAVLNGEALFGAQDASGNYGLWVTNGAAAGTHEITGISGASASGIDPWAMTAFNGEVLFDGTDASGNMGLWVTNGTAAGTHELTGITGAWKGAIPGAPDGISGFLVMDIAALNSTEALFTGLDSNGLMGLWVTNGTAAGTHEITGIANTDTSAPSGSLFLGLEPQYLTPYNGEMLFAGDDASGNQGLWVSNGTASGTYELTGPWEISNGSGSTSKTYGITPRDLTLFNGKVYFDGQSFGSNGSNSLTGLWVTDGTNSGTS
jgi:ELWxxDGT repeat protein